jgi:hypothetical protein
LASLQELITEMAEVLEPLQQQLPDLNVYGGYVENPTPPCIDIYPGTPFQVGSGFGVGSKRVYFTVRARVGTGDMTSAQALLLRLLDPNDPASVEAALLEAGAVVDNQEGLVTGFNQYADDSGAAERMIGSEWRVGVDL